MSLVHLTLVHDAQEAELLCGMLRARGVECSYRSTDRGAGASMGAWTQGGPTEVLVQKDDLKAAQRLLPRH